MGKNKVENRKSAFFILYICLEKTGDRLKAPQSLLDLLPCSIVKGYVCTNECMVSKGTSSLKRMQCVL